MNNILITGGAGFIGANLVCYLVENYTEYNFVNFDALTYAANLSNLDSISQKSNYTFVKGDIRDKAYLSEVFKSYKINGVMHLAAESHVDNSIESPNIFIETNVLGTSNLLDVAKESWESESKNKFLHVSTDEVYGSLGADGFFTENSPYAPNSPYSASKASSDMLVRSYNKTFGLNTTITNCSNNYGQFQHDEKLIPVVIRKALSGENIPIYGNGLNVRDWLYVEDHCRAIDLGFHKGESGETYNIGGDNEFTNLEICNIICSTLDELVPKKYGGKYSDQISFVTDRLGHDFRYAIDATKSRDKLGFEPNFEFSEGIKKTIQWYLNLYTS